MAVMGLDVGSKTIGVAISDELGITAQGLKTITWDENNFKSAHEELLAIINDRNIQKAVIGYPKNMNGTIGQRAEASEHFARHVEKVFHIPTVLWDERMTTMTAERVLLDADVSRKKRKKVIDKMAASIILQSYLDQF